MRNGSFKARRQLRCRSAHQQPQANRIQMRIVRPDIETPP